jgi:hypothetical protein
LKLGWTKSWLTVSAIALAATAIASPQKQPPRGRGANELTLSGIQPGKQKLAAVEKLFADLRAVSTDPGSPRTWEETCSGRKLTLEVDQEGVIQSVDVSLGNGRDTCKNAHDEKREQLWETGQGLKLGETYQRMVEIYGPPNSSGPSMKEQRELQLAFYMFDWAGPDVPQVMEVSCEKAGGRVVEIMLASPSL